MKISEIITRMCEESGQICFGKPIEPATTRDKLLYGDPDQECTGIAISRFASVEVIRQAARKGCNLIVAHESLFWNHGDHIDWLEQNTAFQKRNNYWTGTAFASGATTIICTRVFRQKARCGTESSMV